MRDTKVVPIKTDNGLTVRLEFGAAKSQANAYWQLHLCRCIKLPLIIVVLNQVFRLRIKLLDLPELELSEIKDVFVR
tara:strand:+ start:18185 stop:18415 length:231 start_codon:yes stop_codon:yes gene_type:complete